MGPFGSMLGQHPTHRHTGALWRLVRGSIGRGHDTEAITGAPARVLVKEVAR